MIRTRLRCVFFLPLLISSSTALTPFKALKHRHPLFSIQRQLHNVRGGGESRRLRQRAPPKSSRIEASSMESEEEASRRGKKGMVIALAASYFTVMGAKCALPTVLPLLLDPTVGLVFSDKWNLSPQELVSRQLTLATLAVAVGKLLLGPVIDRFGGILSLQVALSMLGVLLAAISLGSSFLGFAIGWIFVDFIFSSCWAACINAIHQSFPPDQWARQIGTLAAAARAGNAVAFASFAAVLQFCSGRMKQTWRPVFAISAVIQIFPVLLLRYFGGRVNKQEAFLSIKSKSKKPSLGQSLKTLRTEAGTPEFWLHLVSRSSLMVFASFLLFVPTLMCQVYQSSPAFGAQTGSIYALGCLVAVTVVSPVYSRLPCRGKVAMLIGLLSVATASSGAQWAHMAGLVHMSAPMSATILFLWGFAFALPFYIPPSLYALSRGGAQSSATISDVFDFGGFGLLAIFNGYVASIDHARPKAWIPTFLLTTACAALSLFSVSLAVILESRRSSGDDTAVIV